VREPIQLSFEVVNGVGRGIWGIQVPQGERAVKRDFAPLVSVAYFHTEMYLTRRVCEKCAKI